MKQHLKKAVFIMDLLQRTQPLSYRLVLFSGIGLLVSGLAYYMIFRAQLPLPFQLLNLDWSRGHGLTDPTNGTFPSFAFTLSMGLIAIGLFQSNHMRSTLAIWGIFAIGITHEVVASTFAVDDVVAGVLGTVIALLLLSLVQKSEKNRKDLSPYATVRVQHRYERAKFLALMIVSASFATGTSAYDPVYNDTCLSYDENGVCIERLMSATPLYMPYDVLRTSVKMSAPREYESVSRIYLYKNYLFANERNQGIHVIDNTVPTSPIPIAFIEIPGNTEISIRDDNLYVDSYIDLVTLDVSDINNIVEIDREETIFPYNSRQNIPNNVRLVGEIDSTIGVVVGYQR